MLLFFSFQVVSLFSLDAVLGKPRFFRCSKTGVFSFVHCNYPDVKNVFILYLACAIFAAAEDSESFDTDDIEGQKIITQTSVCEF